MTQQSGAFRNILGAAAAAGIAAGPVQSSPVRSSPRAKQLLPKQLFGSMQLFGAKLRDKIRIEFSSRGSHETIDSLFD